jgi:Ca-activated chloride channel homolog
MSAGRPARRRGALPGAARAVALAAALAWIWATPAAACRMALALALDVSSSVDAHEYALQSEGLAQALEDPEVREAALGPGGPIALAIYEWSGRQQQVLVLDWTLVVAEADFDAVAAVVRGHPRSYAEFPTALGYALGYGAALLRRSPPCGRKTLDVSGDGANNDGFEPHHAYAASDFRGVTVNALVVGGASRPALIRYFQTLVIRGPDAFTELAASYEDYTLAMRRKLLRELAPSLVVGRLDEAAPGRTETGGTAR